MIGLGCMRLSTAPDRDDARSAAVLATALAAGVELLDTADAYCHDDSELGHNERLLAAVRGARIVTKGGLVRPDGAWVPNGRGRHLASAARASRDRLGVAAIDLYLLHAVDPKISLATSVRALAKLRDDGIVRAIGLSNVTPTQLDEACAIAEIAAVEIELHPWNLDAIRGGLIARCADRGIDVLAHRPLGGASGVRRAARDPVLREIAARYAATPIEIVLAWLRTLGPITPLPGATRIETVESAVRGQRLELDDDARRALREHLIEVRAPAGHASRTGDRDSTPAEIVMILGMPAAGKSTLAENYVARGYVRLNRDERGGSLLDLARALDGELARGEHATFVVDNTYATRASRAPIVEVARRHGAIVRCLVVDVTIEQAQAHAVHRILDRHGSLDAQGAAKEIRPGVQFRWRRDFEPPNADEGFASIETVAPIARPLHSSANDGLRRVAGLIVELDGVVWTGRPATADRIELRPGVRDALAPWADHVVGATVWRPGATADTSNAIAARLGELLGRTIDVRCCPHPAGPPTCWCRKPLPGLGIALVRDHRLDLARTIHIGRGPADRGFATRVGVRFANIEDGWPTP